MLWPCCAALRCCTHCCIVADLVPGVLAVLGCKGVQLRLFLLLAQAVGLGQQLVLAQDQVAVTPTLGGSKKGEQEPAEFSAVAASGGGANSGSSTQRSCTQLRQYPPPHPLPPPTHPGLGQGEACAAQDVLALDAILLRAVRPHHQLHLVQRGVAAAGAEQAPQLLQHTKAQAARQAWQGAAVCRRWMI